MKVKILKPIRISEVGKTVLPKDGKTIYEISDSAGKVFVKKGFVEEVKKESKPKTEKKEVKKESK